MTDRISKEDRSYNMSRIKGKDTVIELQVRKYLFSLGYRYRKNVRTLPGTPDIVLGKYKTAIFVNGCFWHHHKGCKLAYVPKNNNDFWNAKFKRNVENDRKHIRELKKEGYNVIVVWECNLKRNAKKELEKIVSKIQKN